MSRYFAIANLVSLLFAAVPAALAEDSPEVGEIRELRALVEKQSKQLDALAEQVAKLRITLEKNAEIPLTATPAATGASIATPIEPPFPPNPAPAPAPPPTPEPAEEAPKAEAVSSATPPPGGGVHHVVTKGETLTSIAKHYNLALSELKKANKDVDERKLQIGRSLIIPTPKAAEPAKPKDKN